MSHDDIPETALAWHRAGRGAALATVVQTWGSAPRQPGAQLAISGEAELMGSVSGGCVEGAVAAEALEALKTGQPRLLEYGVTDEDAFAVGLACGGTIRVLVEPVGIGAGLTEAFLDDLVTHRASARGAVVAVDLASWQRALVSAGSVAEDGVAAAAREVLTDERSRVVELDGRQWFLSVHNPPLRLAIVGGSHIAQPLAQMARLAGYAVTLIDPREAFASAERFPGERLVHDWPDAALADHGLDRRTAVVTLTHDPKLDDPGLMAAIRSEAFYIGALGSTRTHAKRVARLEAAGFTSDEIARIDAPIGADIGAQTPAEIAVSVMAELTERLRRPATRPGAAHQPAESVPA